MTVKIAVSAEAEDVLRSLEKIREAIKRSGQEALNFSKIDLSHPELQFVAADLKVVQERLDGLHKVARGDTAAGFRSALGAAKMGPSDFLARHQEWLDHVNQRYPDAADRNRHITNFGRAVFGGTQFSPPPPPEAPPGGGGGGTRPAGGGGGGGLADIGGPALGIAKAASMFMLVQAGITKVADMATRAVDQAEAEAMANDTLMRHVRDTGVDFEHLRDAVRETATGLRLTDDQMQRLSLVWTKATNERSVDNVMANVNVAGGFARGYGMDPGAAVGAFARASYLGEDPKKFAMPIGDAVQAGGQTGQVTEVMQSLLHWSETASKLIVTGSNLEGYAAMYSGMNATRQPGLMGQNAESLIGQIDSSVRQGGAMGDASMAVTYRAFGRIGITDPFEVKYRLDGGMFDKVGKGGETNYELLRDEVNREYAGMPRFQRLGAMAGMIGINTRQAEALDRFEQGAMGLTSEVLKRYNLNWNNIDSSALSDIGEVAGSSSLSGMRDKILGRKDVSDADRASIGGASGEGLREGLIRFLAEHGMDKTVATRAQQSEADLSNALTKAGGGLIGVIADMKGATSGLIEGVGQLSDVLGKWYEGIQKKPDAPAYDGSGLPVMDENGVQLNNAGKPYVPPGPRADGTGLSSGGTAGPVGVTATGAGMTVEERALLDALSGGESKGDYNARNRLGAYGRYQFIDSTRNGLLRQMGLPIGTPLNDELQDRMALKLAKQAGWHPGMTPEQSDAALRGIWVSLPGGKEENTSMDTWTKRLNNAMRDEVGRGTPLPADDPGRRGLNYDSQGRATISPLRVIHETGDGSPIGEEYLPVSMVPAPRATGAGVPR
jgi:hypothetical protein